MIEFRDDGTIKRCIGPMGQTSASAMQHDLAAINRATKAMPYDNAAVAMALETP